MDFGPEAYLAWRISGGALLYRDLAYLYGPFAPHWNGLAMFLFGPTRDVLLWWNFLTYAAAMFALWALVRRYVSQNTAALLALLAVLLSGFNQLTSVANYNFVASYRYGLPHAFALSLFSLLLLERAEGKGSGRLVILSGVFLGLAFLAKPEVFVALAAAHFVAWWQAKKEERTQRAPRILLGALAPCSLWVGFAVAKGMSLFDSVLWPFYPYALVLNRRLRTLPIYDASVEQISWRHLVAWAVLAGLIAAALALAWLISRETKTKWKRAARVPGLVLLLAAVGAVAVLGPAEFRAFTGAWIAGPVACIALLGLALRRPAWRRAIPLSLLVFSIVLSWKVIAEASLAYTGFVLALPCALWLFWMAYEGVPRVLPKKISVHRPTWKLAVGLLFAVPPVLGAQLATERRQAEMTVELTSPTGDFRYYPAPAAVLGGVVKHLKERYAGAGSITVLPEGNYVNFLLRRPSPMPYNGLIPDQVLLFGPKVIIAQLGSAPADVIVILPRRTAEYGVGEFRDGYGREIYEWITRNYKRDPNAPSDTEVYYRE